MKTSSIPSPEKFRAQCTGIGQTRAESERTGSIRSMAVAMSMPPEQAKHAVGYPAPPEAMALLAPMATRRGSLRR